MLQHKKHQLNNGFTLIELIVVMAVFLFVVGAAVSIFVSIVGSQKRILQEQQILSQISYAEEYMSKSLRMAKTAVLPADADCLGGNTGFAYLLTRHDTASGKFLGIKFVNQSDSDTCQEFFVAKENNKTVLKELKNSTNNNDAVNITSEDLGLESAEFLVNGGKTCTDLDSCGAGDGDAVQPRVTIILKTDKIFQTTISQRNLNAQ